MSVTGEKSKETSRLSGRHSPDFDRPNMSMRRMVLVGRTGAGKSSSGNTVLGRRSFTAAKSGSSITKECWKETGEVDGRQIMVVDTPGLFDTDLSENDLKVEISQCINMTAPGPHAIILVISLGPFTQEESQSVEKIQAIFGAESEKYTIILFTRGDELTCSIEEYLTESQPALKDLVHRCGGRYHVFNNKAMEDRMQVLNFLDKVDKMISANDDEHYSSKMYRMVEQQLRRKEEELKKVYEQKLHDQQKQLDCKFQEEKNKLQEIISALQESDRQKQEKIRELQRLTKRQERTLIEYKRYYEEKLKTARKEAEEARISENVLKKIIQSITGLHF